MHKNQYKTMLLILLSALLIFSFTACGKQNNNGEKTITIASAVDIGDLNPHGSGSHTLFALDSIYEGLVKFEDSEIKPALAESWKVSPDGKEIIFNIRQGVKFSDGSDLDANVIKKNFDDILAHKEYWDWMAAIGYLDTYEVVDDYTFKVTFTDSYYPALQEFAAIRPLRMIGRAGLPAEGTTASGIVKPIGTGMWKLEKHVDGEYAVFTKNEYYWGDHPQIDGFTIRVIPDGKTAVSSLEAGEVDMIYDTYESQLMNVTSFNELKNRGYNSFVSQPLLTRLLSLNSTHEPINDIRVREAIAISLDRAAMVKNVFAGTESVADTFFWNGTIYCDIGLVGYDYDPERAAALLDEAGWILQPGNDYRSKNGEIFELDLYYDGNNVIHNRLAQIIQAQLRQSGIKVNIHGEEVNAYMSRTYSGDFDMIFDTTWGDPYDPHSMLNGSVIEGSSSVYFTLKNTDDFDSIKSKIGQVMLTTDVAERKQMYADILTMIHNEISVIPLSYQTNRAITKDTIDGITFNLSNNMPLGSVTVKH